MAEQRLGVDAGEFSSTDRERPRPEYVALMPWCRLLVEGNVGVAVDGETTAVFCRRAELLDVGDIVSSQNGRTR